MPDYDEAIGEDADDEILEELLAGELDEDEDDDEDDDDELSGDEEGLIVGASPREIVGAREIIGAKARKQARRRRRVRRVARMMRKVRSGIVRPDVEKRWRRQVAAVPATPVAVGQIADVRIRPQRLFRIERVSIPSSIAAAVAIRQVVIGQEPQLVASGEIPGEAWSELARDAHVHFDTADIGHEIILTVRNRTDELDEDEKRNIVFRALLFGTAAVR